MSSIYDNNDTISADLSSAHLQDFIRSMERKLHNKESAADREV